MLRATGLLLLAGLDLQLMQHHLHQQCKLHLGKKASRAPAGNTHDTVRQLQARPGKVAPAAATMRGPVPLHSPPVPSAEAHAREARRHTSRREALHRRPAHKAGATGVVICCAHGNHHRRLRHPHPSDIPVRVECPGCVREQQRVVV
jgi:hypothetical protein